jgi:hypothetical protein
MSWLQFRFQLPVFDEDFIVKVLFTLVKVVFGVESRMILPRYLVSTAFVQLFNSQHVWESIFERLDYYWYMLVHITAKLPSLHLLARDISMPERTHVMWFSVNHIYRLDVGLVLYTPLSLVDLGHHVVDVRYLVHGHPTALTHIHLLALVLLQLLMDTLQTHPALLVTHLFFLVFVLLVLFALHFVLEELCPD